MAGQADACPLHGDIPCEERGQGELSRAPAGPEPSARGKLPLQRSRGTLLPLRALRGMMVAWGSAQQPSQHVRPLGSVQHWRLSGEPVAFAAVEVNEAARSSGGVFLKCGSDIVSLLSPLWGTEETGCPVTAQ